MAHDSGNRGDIRSDASPADQELISLVLSAKDDLTQRRWIFEREWYRNILYYVGQQWIIYDESFRRWRRRNMPSWVPLPVTNRLAATVNTIRSAVAQVHPAFETRPTQDNEKSVLSANAAQKYLDVLVQESSFRAMKRRASSWITLTGNCFIGTEYDTSEDTGLLTIPGEECLDCGAQIKPQEIPENLQCPTCGSQNLAESDKSSMVLPQGQLKVRAISPFEVYVDTHIMELEDQPRVLVVETRSIESVKQIYEKEAKDVKADGERDTGRYYLDSLAYITGTGYGSGVAYGRTQEGEDGGAVTLYRLYVKSSKDYPDGCYIVMSGDQHILEKKVPYPFRHKSTKKPFYPLVHLRYDDVPGRFWAKTPVDDLVFKQRQRNEMESLYQTIIMRCANPVWLLPHGVQTTPLTGDPGLLVRYTGAGGLKPERIPGVDAPVSVVKFMEMIDNDFEEIANTFAAMKGKNPGSVRAASAIQMLIERGFGRYGSVFDNLEEGYERWAVQALEIWRQRAVFPRVQAVARLAGSWQFIEFLGADLGDVDIRVEAGSTRPKSQAGRQMLVDQLLQWALLNPNDPEQKMKIFEEMGAASLLPGAEADIKIVAEENSKFIEWAEAAMKQIDQSADIDPQAIMLVLEATQPLEGSLVFDHHPTHLVHHRRFAQSERFRDLHPVLRKLFEQHVIRAHYLPMIQEISMGVGPTGIAVGAAGGGPAGQPGQPGQSKDKAGQPSRGAGPGGDVGPYGAKGGEGRAQSPVSS